MGVSFLGRRAWGRCHLLGGRRRWTHLFQVACSTTGNLIFRSWVMLCICILFISLVIIVNLE
jgi:hypothetical protein